MSQINLEFYLDEAITQIKKQQRKNIRYAPKAKLEKTLHWSTLINKMIIENNGFISRDQKLCSGKTRLSCQVRLDCTRKGSL